MTRLHQVVSALEHDDAVGNEVRSIREQLRARGCESDVFVAVRTGRESEPVRDIEELFAGPAADAVVYHAASASRATAMLAGSGLPLVLVYHNVTPAQWFWGIDRMHYDACATARAELAALAGRVIAAYAHSEFSCQELEAMGFARPGSFPLLVATDSDESDAPSRDKAALTILCVGRIAPNKCVEDVIRVHHAVRHHRGVDVRLRIAGDTTRVQAYSLALRHLVARLEEDASVDWLGLLPRADLMREYRQASLLLSMSEHEGFGGTLVEAMASGTPVIAHDACAVAETLGGAGVLLRGKDPLVAAEVVASVLRDESLRQQLAHRGRRRSAELEASRAFDDLLRLLHEAGVAVPP